MDDPSGLRNTPTLASPGWGTRFRGRGRSGWVDGEFGGAWECNRYDSFLVHCILPETAPLPIIGRCDEAALHGIAVDVAQFIDTFAFGVDIEIVITRLPERFAGAEMARDGLFECLHRRCEGFSLRLGHEEMDVFRHDDIPEDVEFVVSACLFQGALTTIAGSGSA